MEYKITITSTDYERWEKLLFVAKGVVKKLMDRVPLAKRNIYITQYYQGKPTGVWYRFDYDKEKFVRSM